MLHTHCVRGRFLRSVHFHRLRKTKGRKLPDYSHERMLVIEISGKVEVTADNVPVT
jgi:hypothetical protein